MRKVIRLTESDLVKVVKNILLEQNYSEIQGTTDPTPIAKLSVLTDAGLPADNNNFRGRWVLEQPNINKTFSETKNLSLFRNLNPKSPVGGENYIEMTVQKFMPNELNPDRTIKKKGYPDTSTPPVVESLTNSGSKTFNVKYKDPDGKHTWSLIRIVASGNGLLALSRALLEAQGTPNKITIGMSQTKRASGSYVYNAAKIGNITPTLNLLSNMVTASIITKSGLLSPTLKQYVSGDMVSIGTYFNKSNEDIAKLIASSLYFFDTFFIPQDQIEVFRKKTDSSGKLLLPNYNSQPFLDLINTMPVFNDIQGLVDGQGGYQKWKNVEPEVVKLYGKYTELIKNAVVEQYKKRLLAFFTNVYKDANQANQLVSSTQFRSASIKIEDAFNNAVEGVKYTGVAKIDSATSKTTANTYEVGKSKPITNTPKQPNQK